MLAQTSVDAVLLDAGGVLVLPDPDLLRSAFEELGASPDAETCRRAHYAGMREVDRIGKADWVAVDRVVARVAGVPEDRLGEAHSAIERIYLEEPWVPAEGAAEALLGLEAKGIPLAIVSNATGTMEQMLVLHKICGLDDDGPMAKVAVVVDSQVVGVEKPDPRIFGFALQALGLAADGCLYVGDTVHFDVDGARAAGLDPVHLDPYGLCPFDDHVHIAALDELVSSVTLRA